MARGVFGGECKRRATGEKVFGSKHDVVTDEISTGIDSAATFDIIPSQRRIAKTHHKTLTVSLLQSSPEEFCTI
ncbi:unnamed protein product [Phytophthora fragariaefolia]|uniref:Unnamed protein product n=1 Tax=Phytophthora fragariaefolia TaxID=1490495 RepID=A0A9W6YQY5_9STRA|nr:unnamed protein product [Phytophthora fragariaefolia]